MEKTVISVKNVKKSFRVYSDRSVNLKERLLFRKRNRYKMHDVLKGISFDVKKGEAVALIGENGCGKSTTLKMLSRIIYPDSGMIEMKGRVSALIELGAGFHPDMSGRENIYINSAIFGLSGSEIDQRLQRIIDFSELGEYIDSPVRTYSSGMYMRLAFSVAINVDADILLVDEILAVGDAAFQAKCFNKMREIKAKGTTIVIVSHSLGQIEQICDRSCWIKDGMIELEGTPREVHPAYLDYMGKISATKESEIGKATEVRNPADEQKSEINEEKQAYLQRSNENRWGNRDVVITDVRLKNSESKESSSFSTGDKIRIEFDYRVDRPVNNPVVGIGIFRNDGLQCFGTNTQIEHLEVELKKEGIISIQLDEVMLLPGEYTVDLAIHKEDGFAYDYWRFAAKFNVCSSVNDVGVVRIGHTWNFL